MTLPPIAPNPEAKTKKGLDHVRDRGPCFICRIDLEGSFCGLGRGGSGGRNLVRFLYTLSDLPAKPEGGS